MVGSTRREIDRIVLRTLKEAGVCEPPVSLDAILGHLKVDRGFYDLADPALLRRFWHKVKVQGQRLFRIAHRIKLAGVWLPDESHILIDKALHPAKQEWASVHDAGHRLLPWHRPFFLGDTAQTLDPEYQLQLESEASLAASGLMFCGPVFTADARDVSMEWAGVMTLKRRYKKSCTTTLRRFVERGPEHPMVMMVSTPSWEDTPEGQDERWRHFVPSPLFAERFGSVLPRNILGEVDSHAAQRRGGPVADFVMHLRADHGTLHGFHVETFYNQYDNLTLCVALAPGKVTRVIVPGLATSAVYP